MLLRACLASGWLPRTCLILYPDSFVVCRQGYCSYTECASVSCSSLAGPANLVGTATLGITILAGSLARFLAVEDSIEYYWQVLA